ncbi:MAG: UDP-N-acetylmuramoyl-L-alanyl-D-glutamate--2,6-diaminopimelate ligase [Tissierellia bacterium]|nr:UDP-N-acetylmuramoyl-L-alanyl-D-glutamate--2,6-diaminopimelate ligase [Tissierellia bacterium]
MKIYEILEKIDYIEFIGNKNDEVVEITSDSRKVEDLNVFVAIKGYELDGHKFIDKAIENGAKLIVHTKDIKQKPNINYIKVEDDRRAFAEISNLLNDYPAKKLIMIGVTGTNGKTTTSTYIYHILNKLNSLTAMIGTEGSFIGEEPIKTDNTTPEIDQTARILKKAVAQKAKNAVIEASSHALALKRVYGIKFDYAIFTNLTPEHMDFHKTMENYFNDKMILFENADKKIVNMDMEYGKLAKDRFKDTITVAIDNDADYVAKNLKQDGRYVTFDVKGISFKLIAKGNYNVYNALCAMAVLCDIGYKLEEISKVLEEFKGVRSRCEFIDNDLGLDIIVDFAHTPYSFDKLLEGIDNEVVYVVYGINGDRTYEIRKDMGRIAARHKVFSVVTLDDPKFDTVDNISSNIIEGIKEIGGEYVYIKNRKEAIKYAITHAPKTAAVIMIGKGDEDFLKINGNNKIPYSEKDTLREVLEEI